MTFGEVPLNDATGGVLAHSLQAGDLRFRKGRVLSADDIDLLRQHGVGRVVVAQLAPTDIDENRAAARIADALVAEARGDVELTAAFTGRVNVIAKSAGVARIDADRINALNAGDAMITCATVPPFARMEPGGMIATIKIISYGVPEGAVTAAETVGFDALGLHPAKLKTARLIVTQTGAEPRQDKGVDAVRKRLEALGMDLHTVVSVPHRTKDLSAAIKAGDEDLILILTASATSDPADVAPEALRCAGGAIARVGMPVDPGNLLFIGDLAGTPVIGLPGCARSPALNGADWVLERVACGVSVTDADIAAMGVGGLLKEIPQRPQPRRGKS